MGARQVIAAWGGAGHDILSLTPGESVPPFGADPSDEDDTLVLYRLLDSHDEATGEIVGVEIDEFLQFNRWDLIPSVDQCWQLPGRPPHSLVDVLKTLQHELGPKESARAVA
jgi:hypothetical protein